MTMEKLPREVLELIFARCRTKDLRMLSCVSKNINQRAMPLKMARQSEKAKRPKVTLKMLALGPAHSGKKSITGYLLSQCGGIDKRTLNHMARQMSTNTSFDYSWVHTLLTAERERGINIDIGPPSIQTKKYYHVINETPSGNRDFIKNIITGSYVPDYALLVISAIPGEIEAKKHCDHVLLADTAGLRKIIVVINKMDDKSVDWSQDRFNEIKRTLTSHFESSLHYLEKVFFVPLSSLTGDNVLEKSPNMGWYKGPTLVEALDHIGKPKQPIHKPLRIPLQGVFDVKGVGTVAFGKVASGVLKCGQNVTFAPSAKPVVCEVKSVEMHHTPIPQAMPGETVGFHLAGVQRDEVQKGMVCGDPDRDPPSEAIEIVAQIVVLNHPGKISVGYAPLIELHTAHVPCKFVEFLAKIDRGTGMTLEGPVKELVSGDVAVVRLVPLKPVCVEPYRDYPDLGRLVVRERRQTVAVGLIKSVVKKPKS